MHMLSAFIIDFVWAFIISSNGRVRYLLFHIYCFKFLFHLKSVQKICGSEFSCCREVFFETGITMPRVPPGDFTGEGANTSAACADPAMAAFWHGWCMMTRGRPVLYRGNTGLSYEVRNAVNMNGGLAMDQEDATRVATRRLVRRVVLAALSRQG